LLLAAKSATVRMRVVIAGLTVICTVNPAIAAVESTIAEFAALRLRHPAAATPT
jgi:hypothetical protein